MARAARAARAPGFGKTSRRDAWWLQPLAVFLVLGGFIVYATWAAFQNAHYFSGPYLSPFYSPEIFGASSHAWFGPKPDWFPAWLPFSPALFILWAPAGFRLTCYYYRGAYYKAFWADPPSCAVGEPRKGYTGEHGPPLILQNVHRYFLYLAIFVLAVLWYDVWKALWFERAPTPWRGGVNPLPDTEFGIGLGTLVLALNAALLTGYTFGCHSLRHLIGGRVDCLAGKPVKSACYGCVSKLNSKHMLWAWLSLFSVALADLYVRLMSLGAIADVRLL